MTARRLENVGRAVAGLFIAAFVLAPFAMTLLASVTPDAALISRPPAWFSQGFSLDNYLYILTGAVPAQYQVDASRSFSMVSQEIRQLPVGMVNSMIASLAVMVVNVTLGSMAAHALGRLQFRGKRVALNVIMASRLIPAVALAIPFFGLMQDLRLTNNLLSLVLIYSALTLPVTILFLTASFLRVDRAIEEAAQIDGLNPMQILLRIVVPLSRPALVGAALFSFMLSYSEFLFGLLLVTQQSNRTLPVMLASVSVNPDVSLGLITAGIVLGITPTLVVIVPIWRFMLRGLAEGALKD